MEEWSIIKGLIVKFAPFDQIVACILWLAAASGAQAGAPVDCDAVKTTPIPAELTFHTRDTVFTIQAFRGAAGKDVIWTKQETPVETRINKTLAIDGRISANELRATMSGKRTAIKFKYDFEGMPKNFDRRTNIDFKVLSVASDDGSTNENLVVSSYKFKSESPVTVGFCVLSIVRGDLASTSGKTDNALHHIALIYLPELRVVASSLDAEIVFDDIKTAFTPLTLPQ